LADAANVVLPSGETVRERIDRLFSKFDMADAQRKGPRRARPQAVAGADGEPEFVLRSSQSMINQPTVSDDAVLMAPLESLSAASVLEHDEAGVWGGELGLAAQELASPDSAPLAVSREAEASGAGGDAESDGKLTEDSGAALLETVRETEDEHSSRRASLAIGEGRRQSSAAGRPRRSQGSQRSDSGAADAHPGAQVLQSSSHDDKATAGSVSVAASGSGVEQPAARPGNVSAPQAQPMDSLVETVDDCHSPLFVVAKGGGQGECAAVTDAAASDPALSPEPGGAAGLVEAKESMPEDATQSDTKPTAELLPEEPAAAPEEPAAAPEEPAAAPEEPAAAPEEPAAAPEEPAAAPEEPAVVVVEGAASQTPGPAAGQATAAVPEPGPHSVAEPEGLSMPHQTTQTEGSEDAPEPSVVPLPLTGGGEPTNAGHGLSPRCPPAAGLPQPAGGDGTPKGRGPSPAPRGASPARARRPTGPDNPEH